MITRARFYAFALNEFQYKRVQFSLHRTQVAAEAAAYRFSGQKRRQKRRDFNGTEAPQDDLFPQVIAGLEGFEKWAKESRYKIDWTNRELIYQEGGVR